MNNGLYVVCLAGGGDIYIKLLTKNEWDKLENSADQNDYAVNFKTTLTFFEFKKAFDYLQKNNLKVLGEYQGSSY